MAGVFGLIAKRLGLGLITLFVVSVIIFGAVELLPGDVAQQVLGQAATEETVAALREEMGLNRPAPVRYFDWLTSALQGDFGTSLANGRSVAEQLGPRFANTLFLAALAAMIAVPLAITLGVLVALFRNSVFDRVMNALSLVSISSPEFFLGYILIVFLAVQNQVFPAIANVTPDMDLGERTYRSMLPAITMALVVMAYMMRMTRAAIINLLASPYIEMARLKGVPQQGDRPPRAAQRAGADHQRRCAQPRLPDHRRRAGRGGVRLSRRRPACWSTACPNVTSPWCRPAA
jgi:peptide/nickel transport system permease protein